jgi:hypothetical protein
MTTRPKPPSRPTLAWRLNRLPSCGAGVHQDAAFEVEHGFQAAAQVFAAAEAPARGVLAARDHAHHAAAVGGGVVHVFDAGVDQAIDLDVGLGVGGAFRESAARTASARADFFMLSPVVVIRFCCFVRPTICAPTFQSAFTEPFNRTVVENT